MLICDARAGTIVSVSRAATQFLAREDLPGRSLAEILPEATFAARLREIAELTTDDPRETAWTFLGSGGRSVVAPVTLARAGNRCIIVIATGAAGDRVDASARLAYLLRATSAITYSCAALGDDGASRVTFISENVTSVLGYDAAEFLDNPRLWFDSIHPDDRSGVVASMGPLIEQGGSVIEYRFRHKDGSWRWMHDETSAECHPDGRLKELIGSWVDVTPRREIEEALKRSESSFRAVIEHLPQAVFVRLGMAIVYANAACARLLGFESSADIIGRSPLELSPAYDTTATKQRIALADATGRSTPRECEWQRRDGSAVAVEIEALAIEYHGKPAILVIARDLTERRAMVARAAVADRIVARATLAAGVAHEINGPLAFLVTNLSILADELPGLLGPDAHLLRRSRADIEGLLRDAQEGAMRVRDVVRDLRLLARPAEETNAHCDLGEVLSSCAKMAWSEIDGRARFVADIGEIRPVRGGASRLAQVFSNLIVNAAHAIAPNRPDDNEIRLIARTLGTDSVIVEISDTGAGIAPENLTRIFEPFFTTKPAGVGTGLGLAICEVVIASVGGSITVESELGRGTRMSVVLPVAAPRTDTARPPEARSENRGRVLVVDDDPAFTNSVRLLLDDHEVAAFTNAALALDHIRVDPSFDVVLCDMTMPDLDGMQLHAKVVEIAPLLASRVIFVTGGALTPEAQSFLARSTNMVLEKPFDPAELTALVSRLVCARGAAPLA